MEPIFQQDFQITDNTVDRYGRLKPSTLLYFVQELSGQHCNSLTMDYDALAHPYGNLAHAHHPGGIPPKRGGL